MLVGEPRNGDDALLRVALSVRIGDIRPPLRRLAKAEVVAGLITCCCLTGDALFVLTGVESAAACIALFFLRELLVLVLPIDRADDIDVFLSVSSSSIECIVPRLVLAALACCLRVFPLEYFDRIRLLAIAGVVVGVPRP